VSRYAVAVRETEERPDAKRPAVRRGSSAARRVVSIRSGIEGEHLHGGGRRRRASEGLTAFRTAAEAPTIIDRAHALGPAQLEQQQKQSKHQSVVVGILHERFRNALIINEDSVAAYGYRVWIQFP